MNVAERLKKLRISKGLSTPKIAEMTGLPQSVISKLENGNRKADIDTLTKVLDALGITLSEFFAEDNKELTSDLRKLTNAAKDLTPEQRAILTQFIQSMKDSPSSE